MTQTLDVSLAAVPSGNRPSGNRPSDNLPSNDRPSVTPPSYAHPGDAGADLLSAESLTLRASARALVSTGVSIALPDGYAAFVMPRSGLAAKHGITVLNAPGTVDAGYRGEIKVTLLNTDPSADYDIAVGDKIAQLVVMPVIRARFVEVESLPESTRGTSGFGSTGYAPSDSAPDDQTAQSTPGGTK